jgi:hypothetical protein
MVFIEYPKQGIAFFVGFGRAMQYLSNIIDQNKLTHGVYLQNTLMKVFASL